MANSFNSRLLDQAEQNYAKGWREPYLLNPSSPVSLVNMVKASVIIHQTAWQVFTFYCWHGSENRKTIRIVKKNIYLIQFNLTLVRLDYFVGQHFNSLQKNVHRLHKTLYSSTKSSLASTSSNLTAKILVSPKTLHQQSWPTKSSLYWLLVYSMTMLGWWVGLC